jgi:tRNA(Ile)-lysidine synthetase-like protein
VELLFRQAAGPDGHLTRRHVTAILGLLRRAGSVPLPGGFRATRAGDRIVVGAPSGLRGAGKGGDGGAAPMRIDLPVGRWVAWPALSWQVRIRRAPAGVRPGRGLLWSALVDAAILRAPLALRAWQAGDRFHPLGAPGRKKLQDFFVDAKVARPLRGKIPLLVGAGEIVCVVGYRAAEGCRARGRGEAACIEVRRREGSDAVSAGIGLDPCAPDPGPGRGVGGRHLR